MSRLRELALALLAVAGIVSTVAASTTQPSPDLTPDQVNFVKWGLEQGGLFVVIVVVLYFYRRDFRAASLDRQAITNALLHVVQANITAMQAMKDSEHTTQQILGNVVTGQQQLTQAIKGLRCVTVEDDGLGKS